MSEPSNKCHNCQANLGNWWLRNEEKGYNICYPCLEELEKKGELWDNFFTNTSGSEGSAMTCNFCAKPVQNCQQHQNENGRLIIKHNCQKKCISDCKKKFQLTQAYMDFFLEYTKDFILTISPTCPNCWIKEVKKDIKTSIGQEEKKKNQKLLQELEKLTGKNNNDGNNIERERERERERANSNSNCWIRGSC